jgi:hypothetical protein
VTPNELRAAAVAGYWLLVAGCSSLPIDAVELTPMTLNQGLVAHWSFDDGEGSSLALDTSGNNHNGTLTGGTWISDGRFSGALQLLSGEYVTVAPSPFLAVPATSTPSSTPASAPVISKFSVSAWVRIHTYLQDTTADGVWGTVISTEVGNTGGWEVNVSHRYADPGLNFAYWNGRYLGGYDYASCTSCMPLPVAGSPSTMPWTQVVAVVDRDNPNTISLYINGQLQGTSQVPEGILPGNATLTIGQWPSGGRYLIGDIDDIAIWNRALVPSEVVMLNSQPVPGP